MELVQIGDHAEITMWMKCGEPITPHKSKFTPFLSDSNRCTRRLKEEPFRLNLPILQIDVLSLSYLTVKHGSCVSFNCIELGGNGLLGNKTRRAHQLNYGPKNNRKPDRPGLQVTTAIKLLCVASNW